MELCIRSQDKMKLSRFIDLRIVLEQEGALIIDNTDDYILGMYNSEERALEVLDEIQDAIDNGIKETRYDSVGSKYYKVKTDKKVYEMPKE